MMTETVADPRAWTAASMDSSGAWSMSLPPSCRAILEARTRQCPSDQERCTAARLEADERADCRRDLKAALGALERGRGFVILEGEAGTAELRMVYWLVGQALGEPLEQNIQGTLLYDVRDTGGQLSEGARFSVTSYESSFHTDNSFGATLADYVGLLCIRPAQSGGVSQLVSGLTVCRILRERHPEALAILQQTFHVDRRGGVRQGESPTICQPIITLSKHGPAFRYLRYWIEAGHQKVGQPLTAAQVAALDTLDAVLARPELRVEFTMKAGDMLFINNRWLLHNRTAFVDFPEPAERRHLVRLWLQAVAE
jgi:hypothetical protein